MSSFNGEPTGQPYRESWTQGSIRRKPVVSGHGYSRKSL